MVMNLEPASLKPAKDLHSRKYSYHVVDMNKNDKEKNENDKISDCGFYFWYYLIYVLCSTMS